MLMWIYLSYDEKTFLLAKNVIYINNFIWQNIKTLCIVYAFQTSSFHSINYASNKYVKDSKICSYVWFFHLAL